MLKRIAAILLATGAFAFIGGCSTNRNLGAFAEADLSEVTGSISRAQSSSPNDADLAFARIAASDVLTKGGKDSSQPWENPATGSHGSVTPLASAYTADGRNCRNFLASYVNGKQESWMQGEACQSGKGRWDVKALRPWRRS